MKKLPGAGNIHGPYTVVVELGPFTLHNHTDAEAKKQVKEHKEFLDNVARSYFDLGPRSKFVQSRVVEEVSNEG